MKHLLPALALFVGMTASLGAATDDEVADVVRQKAPSPGDVRHADRISRRFRRRHDGQQLVTLDQDTRQSVLRIGGPLAPDDLPRTEGGAEELTELGHQRLHVVV